MCWLIIMSGVSLGMKRKKMCRQMTHLFSFYKCEQVQMPTELFAVSGLMFLPRDVYSELFL